LILQKYSITFVDEESLEKSRGRSGNPGYIPSLPLLVGKNDPSAAEGEDAGKLVYQDGFTVRGGDVNGNCLSSDDVNYGDDESFGDIGDPTLLFENDLTYGCNIDMALAELKGECNDSGYLKKMVDNFKIFKDLEFIEFVGTFGDADF
jgi:hypothetical protein